MVASGDSWHADVCRPAFAVGVLLTFIDIEPEAVSADNSLMTEESVAKTIGTKKKSFFQITKVEVDQGNAEEDGDEDGDDIDGDEDGEEENMAKESVTMPSVDHVDSTVVKTAVDSRLQQSTSLQSSSTSSIANGASTSNTASKFRVVRITTNTLNKKYTRGRWLCLDFIESDSSLHCPNDHEHDIVTGDTARRESALDGRALHSFAEPSHGGNRTGCVKADVRRVCDESPASVATSADPSNHLTEINRTSNVFGQGRDPQGRILGNEDQGARDRLNQVLATVRNLIIDYSAFEQRDRDVLQEQNTALRARIQHLQDREQQLLAEIENIRADNRRLQEDNRKLSAQLVLACSQQLSSKSLT